MPTFSDIAYDKLLDLYKNHAKEVGSQLKKREPETYKGFQATDCITYVINVLTHTFKSLGNEVAAKNVRNLGAYGTELAKYLVDKHAWTGIYINPDVIQPFDADPEHTYTNALVTKTCKYYKIPLGYRAVNYSPTPVTDPGDGSVTKKVTIASELDKINFAALNKVKFGFGVSRGGKHTWLFAYGSVYEVHWDKTAASGELYEATPLSAFGWASGAIVVPGDQAGWLAGATKLACR